MQPRTIFTLNFEGQEMRVHYFPNYFSNYAHFEFRSPYDPARPIPVSETGYRSHFIHMQVLESAPSIEDCAHAIATALMEEKRPIDQNQFKLF